MLKIMIIVIVTFQIIVIVIVMVMDKPSLVVLIMRELKKTQSHSKRHFVITSIRERQLINSVMKGKSHVRVTDVETAMHVFQKNQTDLKDGLNPQPSDYGKGF